MAARGSSSVPGILTSKAEERESYHEYVFCLHASDGPLLTTVELKFNTKNRIEVEECGKNALAGVYKKPENYRLPLEKGKLMYSFLELKSILEKIAEFNQ